MPPTPGGVAMAAMVSSKGIFNSYGVAKKLNNWPKTKAAEKAPQARRANHEE
jgi:hypothetical protein